MPLRPQPATLHPRVVRRPEILAPAGDRESLAVALAAGADAVYLGLDEGFNARARATNFPVADLARVAAQVHRAGARLYITLNTLVFESELNAVADLVRQVAEAGADALIVQDPALCLLARAIAPDLELHASTQMTVSSVEGARFATRLGVTRVVLPRELSVTEVAAFSEGIDVETEVFIHGALCVSWSGQCLSSEAWGGRSANRGQCAQACRMPYTLLVDGDERPLGGVEYLLSPRDLAGQRAVPQLMASGVHTLKIEGRLKGPAYVWSTVRGLRAWIDAVVEGRADSPEAQRALAADMGRMMLAYSRGFSDGFLGGSDHQTLVEGRFPKHRGMLLGHVVEVRGDRVRVAPPTPEPATAVGVVASPLVSLGQPVDASVGPPVLPPDPRPGIGVGFDQGRPEADEPGGPIFEVQADGSGWWLTFGTPGPNLARVRAGDRVWLTSDPSLAREALRAAQHEPEGRIPVEVQVRGSEGEPLEVHWRVGLHSVVSRSASPLTAARGRGLDPEVLASKLCALGGTPFRLGALSTVDLAAELHLPVSELKSMRRDAVDALRARVERGPAREANAVDVDALRARGLASALDAMGPPLPEDAPIVVPLCRTDEQLDAVLASGCREVELDWMEMVGLGHAVERARAAGAHVTLATVRVQKPGEEGFDRRLAKLAPQAVLVRHWGALSWFADAPAAERPLLHGDFSLNVTNSLTALHLLGQGLSTVTAAHDLDERQLLAMLREVPAERVAVTVHHHIPTFHTEHCVYSHTLSRGRDYRTCGRPCEEHRVALRDHLGFEHPVIVDVGCRNTVFNARAQSAARLVPRLLEMGVRRLRVEFVWETGEQAARVLSAYEDLAAGRTTPAALVEAVGAHEQFGVTRGTMKTLRAEA